LCAVFGSDNDDEDDHDDDDDEEQDSSSSSRPSSDQFKGMESSMVLTRAGRKQQQQQQHGRKSGLMKSKWNGSYGTVHEGDDESSQASRSMASIPPLPEQKQSSPRDVPVRKSPTRTDSRELALDRRYERRHAILAEVGAAGTARSSSSTAGPMTPPPLIEMGTLHQHESAAYLKALQQVHATTIQVECRGIMPELVGHLEDGDGDGDDSDDDDDDMSHSSARERSSKES
jgi:hypothetical protein